MSDTHHSDVLIIGAGMSGLMAASVLVAAGRRVTLLDKGRSVGGRLATRRIGAGRADHGAQFFTVRDPEFGAWVERWRDEGLVYVWSHGWSDGSLADAPPDGHPRYAVQGGMNRLAKHLAAQVEAQGAEILTDVRVTAVTPHGDGWRLIGDDGRNFIASALIMTAPAPQTLAMLDAGATPLTAEDRACLERIRYAPALCGLYVVEGEVHLPAPGAVQRPDADFTWIADNRRKGISPDATVITVHASGDWSAARYDAPDAELSEAFECALRPWLAADAWIAEEQIKRWRYAAPTVLHPERLLRVAAHAPLLIGGDAFGAPRVEGAALSGLAIGRAL
ncbi:MAG TPA: FAD-dependent oxidoreductase [Chloroflexi bacterium]|nr:FAD-dependent oxidoreductase [Chloroflexota bacterium]HHW88317.1 NAD(P)-binding protein [Chloroflexota bacterium]